MKKTVLVAMSGGVDSSLAAALLKEEGFNVIGVTMELFTGSGEIKNEPDTCSRLKNIIDAQQIASELGITHYVLDLKKEFQKSIIDYFISEYTSGRTPNPCIRCNKFIKFGILIDKANQLGAEYIATGHYARIEKEQNGPFRLKRAIDSGKDQSYFLYTMTQEQLQRTLMPLGTFKKEDVRRMAKEMGLHVHQKQESQEICFIERSDYRDFLKSRHPEYFIPGPILDKNGKIIGEHQGIPGYTIGQRRGLGLSSSTPLYVIEINREKNAIIAGERKYAYHNELIAEEINWIVPADQSSGRPRSLTVKIRSIHEPAEALLFIEHGGKVRVLFRHPQWAITPGQAAVFYDGDTVIGGGIILSGRRVSMDFEKIETKISQVKYQY